MKIVTPLIRAWNLDFTKDRKANTRRILRHQTRDFTKRGKGNAWVRRLIFERNGAIDLGFAILYP